MTREHIRFREGDAILTMWVEKRLEDDVDPTLRYVVGWVPEKRNNWVVHEDNIVTEETL
jgi:hypothetical protein